MKPELKTFNNAAEVKAYLKEKGFTAPVTVRKSRNPFGGADAFAVEPKGITASVMYSGGSDIPSTFSSSDPAVTKLYADLQEALKGTRTIVS